MAQKKQTIKGKIVKKTTPKKVENITTNKVDTKKGTNIPKPHLDTKTIEILAGLGVLITIISFITMGLFPTLLLVIGVSLIIFMSILFNKMAKNSKRRKIINGIVIAFLGLCILGSIAVGGILIYVVQTAPDFNPNLLNNKESSIFYSSANNEYAKLGTELRENIKYEDLPQVFIDALIATEDSRFFQHDGFDAPRFIKATIGQATGKNSGGASTLSMQVIKNSFTSSIDKGFQGVIRKFTDIYLAVFKLEKNYTKEQIIEFYVNNHGLGGTIFGVEEAAQAYFGKSIRQVNLAEAAILVGMFQAPTSYNPITKPDSSEKRRNTVINLMVRHGYISEEEAIIAKNIPVSSLVDSNGGTKKLFEHQAYLDTVLDELNERFGISYTSTPVLVYTNLDEAKQKGLNDIFNGTSFTWANDKVQSGVAVVENSTGKLIAVGAGRNRQGARSLNYADQRRQIGSTAKPIFDYAPGMEYNNWSTYQQFVDEPWSYTGGKSINNADGKFQGQMSLRYALAYSRNIPALKAFQSVDNKNIQTFVNSLGIETESYLHEAHALGAFKGATPIEMAAAYAAFGNGGYYTEAYTISKVVYRDTGEEVVAKAERKQVMSDSTAFMITDVLKTSVNEGLSSGAKLNGVNLAAKTGTSSFDDQTKKAYNLPSNAVNDAWISGYDPEYSVSMWYGYENIKEGYSTDVQGVVQRGKLYKALGNVVFQKNNQDFKMPNSVVKVGVEARSNPAMLPSDGTPQNQIVYEYFKTGTEPTESSSNYKRLDSVTNLTGTYNATTKKVTLRWSGIKTPTGNSSYGEFGYNVYYNDILLDFTKETQYEIDTTAPDGIYKVVSIFKNYAGNQSNPTTVTIKSDSGPSPSPSPSPGPTPSPSPSNPPVQTKYNSSLIGNKFISISLGGTFIDSTPPISIKNLTTNEEVADRIIKAGGLKTTIKDIDGKVVTTIYTTKATVYTITYDINYDGYKSSLTRTIAIK